MKKYVLFIVASLVANVGYAQSGIPRSDADSIVYREYDYETNTETGGGHYVFKRSADRLRDTVFIQYGLGDIWAREYAPDGKLLFEANLVHNPNDRNSWIEFVKVNYEYDAQGRTVSQNSYFINESRNGYNLTSTVAYTYADNITATVRKDPDFTMTRTTETLPADSGQLIKQARISERIHPAPKRDLRGHKGKNVP
jgi:hypothetical protein